MHMKEWRRLLLQLGRVSLHANITVLLWGQLLFLPSLVLGHIWQMCLSFQICPSLCRVCSSTCSAVARKAGSSVSWGTGVARPPRHVAPGLAAQGLSHKAPGISSLHLILL